MPHGIPDFCQQTDTRILVPAGQSIELARAVQTSCLGIHGTVTLTGTVTLDNLLVYADGALTCDGGTIVIRDKAIDLATDPEQFGQGVIGFGKVTFRGCTVKSENPAGTRGHVLLTQRADIDIRGSRFLDLGRTCTDAPPHSATLTNGVWTVGTCQIGRYALHLHHVNGPLPVTSDRQFRIIGNRFERGGKWGGVTLHNSHFGLVQDNVCVQAVGSCYVEEDGSETDNHWIGNYAGQISNPSVIGGEQCMGGRFGVGYDPFALCGSGFWLRGINNVLVNNVVEDARVGIGWWTLCVESGEFSCGNNLTTIPKFPGADTTDPAQVFQGCFDNEDGGLSPKPCRIAHRVGLRVDGNTIRRVRSGLEHWWTQRANNGSAPITNTTIEDAEIPLDQHYSDVAYDGLIATRADYRGVAWSMFNDGQPIGRGRGQNLLRRAVLRGFESCWSRAGQLDHPPLLTIADSVCQSTKGIALIFGGQTGGGTLTQDFRIHNTRFEAAPGQPLVAITVSKSFEWNDAQRITTTVTAFNGNPADNFTIISPNEASPCQTTRPEVVGGFACASDAAPLPVPEPTPTPEPIPVPVPVPVPTPAPICVQRELAPGITLTLCEVPSSRQ